MELKEGRIENKKPPHKKKHVRSALREFITTVSHICIFIFTILIIYLAIKDTRFFTLHPLFLAIGWCLSMSEAILMLSKDNLAVKQWKHDTHIMLHWVMLVISAIFIVTGGSVAFINKNNHTPPKEHFQTWHAIFGLIAVGFSVPPYINGVLLYFKKELRDYLNPRISKFIHVMSAGVSFTFGNVAVILGLYSNWFVRNSKNNPYVFYLALVTTVIPALWCLYKPVKIFYNNIKNIKNL